MGRLMDVAPCRQRDAGPRSIRTRLVDRAQLAIDDAIALAQARALNSPASPRPHVLNALTPRKTDVARLVASVLTNRQIGEALVITEKTAANHVQGVLDKLGMHSRTQLAARAAQPGLGQDPQREHPSESR
jgi:DNA-binding NarL/FixJ family response regulator